MVGTMPRWITSAANSRGVQWLMGRPEFGRRFAGDDHQLGDLFRGEGWRGARTGSIGQEVFDGPQQSGIVRVGGLQGGQSGGSG